MNHQGTKAPRFFYRDFGRNVTLWRVTRKLTQAELAKRIGLSRTSVVNIETGHQRILFHTVYVLARALNVTPETLLP